MLEMKLLERLTIKHKVYWKCPGSGFLWVRGILAVGSSVERVGSVKVAGRGCLQAWWETVEQLNSILNVGGDRGIALTPLVDV
nr:hypothetical protein [Tanacetum cinerariifolium]